MCNLSQEVYEKGMAQGIAQGMAQGVAQGVAQGMAQMLKKAMDKNGWSLEEAMRFFDLPASDKDKFAAALN